MEVELLPWKLVEASMEVELLPWKLHIISIFDLLPWLPWNFPWKLPCTSMEASTNFHGSKSNSNNFHGNSMEVHILPPTSMEASSRFSSMLPWKLVEFSRKVDRTEVGGPLWKSCGRSWKYAIRWKMFVEAAIDGSIGTFLFHEQWKLLCTTEGSTNFYRYESTSTSTNFH